MCIAFSEIKPPIFLKFYDHTWGKWEEKGRETGILKLPDHFASLDRGLLLSFREVFSPFVFGGAIPGGSVSYTSLRPSSYFGMNW